MIAVCRNPSCRAIFEFKGITFEGSGSIILRSINVDPCPVCGSTGYIPEGIYEYKDYVLTLVSGPRESMEILKKVKRILEYHKKSRTFATKQDIINEIEKISPRSAQVIKSAPSTSNVISWIALAIAAIHLIIYIQQSYFNNKENINETKFTDMFIQHLLNENAEIKNKYISLDTIRKDTLTTERRDTSIIKKTQRNDPCPCNSGKKYKKCCGSLNKN